jgi:hypothetical protein
MGGLSKQDYQQMAPPGSFIHVEDFNSTLDLANYINYLNTNPQEYNKYHYWRDKYSGTLITLCLSSFEYNTLSPE